MKTNMAGVLRVERVGGWYHITARGNERRAIFRDDRDRAHWCQRMRSALSNESCDDGAVEEVRFSPRVEQIVEVVEEQRGKKSAEFCSRHGDKGRGLALSLGRKQGRLPW